MFYLWEKILVNSTNSGYFLRVFGVTGTMNEINLLDFDRGWILGNFDPSIMGRSDIEI